MLNIYRAFYKGRTLDVHARTTLEAQTKAAQQFKARKAYDVSVMLLQLGGRDVVHNPAVLP